MATVTMYRCTVPHFQGDMFVAVGALYPDGSPAVAGDLAQFFEAETHEVDAPKRATTTKKATE